MSGVSNDADRVVQMLKMMPHAVQFTAIADCDCNIIYVRLPRTANFDYGSVFEILTWAFDSQPHHFFHYTCHLQILQLRANIQRRLKWYRETFCLLRHLQPKLVADLILCFCALQDRQLSFAIAEGLWLFRLRNFFRRKRPFIDVPIYTCNSADRKEINVSLSLRQQCDQPIYLVSPRIFDQKPTRMNWHFRSSDFVGHCERTFCMNVPAATFVILVTDQSFEKADPYDVFAPFSSVQVCIGDEKTVYDYDSIFWFGIGPLAWYFVPLRKVAFDCKFAALHDDRTVMDNQNEDFLELTINTGCTLQRRKCFIYVGMLD